jgi:prepilin-type N-terminal cleavage/methylation domain-containing protein
MLIVACRLRCRGLTLIELVVVLTILVALGSIVIPLFGEQAEEASGDATRATLARVAQAIVGTGGYAEAMRYARDSGGVIYGAGTGLPWPGPDDVAAARRPNHPQLHYLYRAPVFDDQGTAPTGDDDELPYYPDSKIGWRGAWLDATTATGYPAALDEMVNRNTASANGFGAAYGEPGDLAPLDGWGSPVVIQLPSVAAGITDDEVDHVRLLSAGPDGVLDTPATTLTPSLVQKNDDLVVYLYREDPNP